MNRRPAVCMWLRSAPVPRFYFLYRLSQPLQQRLFLVPTLLQGPLGWRLLFGVALLPAAAVMVVVPWLYETPNRYSTTPVELLKRNV